MAKKRCRTFSLLDWGVSVERRLTYMDKWNKDNGFARILPYDKEKGAIYYMVKYVVKGGEIDPYIPKKNIQKPLFIS
jgi:hypothetical protein